MPGRIDAPETLFLAGAVDAPERQYLGPLFRRLRERGFTRFVEPCAGTFAMSAIAVQEGWAPTQIEASDITLFSTLLGYAVMDKRIDDLEIVLDGEEVGSTRETVLDDVTELLYQQLRIRMDRKPEVPYWDAIREDLEARRDEHISDIMASVSPLCDQLRGIEYIPLDAKEHLRRVRDDAGAVIAINSPNYSGGYEKFYETEGRLTWAEPPYETWDGTEDIYRMMEDFETADALVIAWHQTAPGTAAGHPVYARHSAEGRYIYLTTNKPDLVKELMGGPRVMPKPKATLMKMDKRVIPPDHEIKPSSPVEVVHVPPDVATYYRSLWMHRIDFKPTAAYFAVIVDDFLVGVGGYDLGPLVRPYPGAGDWMRGQGFIVLTFAVGPMHDTYRLTRLAAMAALTRETIDVCFQPRISTLVKRLMTSEFTKYPEAKGNRGIMKLHRRDRDPKHGYKLVYTADVLEQPIAETLKSFLRKEANWRKSRKQSPKKAKK